MELFKQGKAILYEGREIPLGEVLPEHMCDPRSLFPDRYDWEELPLKTQGEMMLCLVEIKRCLGLE